MRGTLGPCRVGRRLTDGFAKRDANATVIECSYKTKSHRSEPGFGSAGSEVKRVRHGNEGVELEKAGRLVRDDELFVGGDNKREESRVLSGNSSGRRCAILLVERRIDAGSKDTKMVERS